MLFINLFLIYLPLPSISGEFSFSFIQCFMNISQLCIITNQVTWCLNVGLPLEIFISVVN